MGRVLQSKTVCTAHMKLVVQDAANRFKDEYRKKRKQIRLSKRLSNNGLGFDERTIFIFVYVELKLY